MKNKTSNGGYMMILMLLISVVIMIFLMMKDAKFLQKGSTNLNNTNTSEQGINNLSPIDSAKEAKNLIEQDNKRAIEQLE